MNKKIAPSFISDGRVRYITDLSQCSPFRALSREVRSNKWRIVDYETDEFNGTMLMAGPESKVPDLRLHLPVSGNYCIFLGMYSLDPREPERIRLKLSDDKAPWLLKPEPTEIDVFDRIEEVYWKTVRLNGQDLIISHPGLSPSVSYLAYVKLVPSDEMPAHQGIELQAQQATQKLIAMNDGFGILCAKGVRDRSDIHEDIEPYRNTDVGRLYWCVGSGGDVYTAPSRIGKSYGRGVKAFPRLGDRKLRNSINVLERKRIHLLREVLDYGREMGLKVYFSLRLEAFACSPPRDSIFTGKFFLSHPEWRCRDRDGVEIARMSYAFPGVQDFVIRQLEELAGLNPDGVSLLFPRGAPYLLYETIMVEEYVERFGVDPRTLPEDDESWLRFRTEYMTNFMRKLRKRIPSGIAVSAHTLSDHKTNLFYGLDPGAWITEGLLDELVGYPWHDKPVDVDYYLSLTKSTNCPLFIELFPRSMPPEEYRRKAQALYAKGVDGLSLWDTNARHVNLRQWSMVRRLGHAEELGKWTDGEGLVFRTVPVRTIGSYRVDRYSPAWSY